MNLGLSIELRPSRVELSHVFFIVSEFILPSFLNLRRIL